MENSSEYLQKKYKVEIDGLNSKIKSLEEELRNLK